MPPSNAYFYGLVYWTANALIGGKTLFAGKLKAMKKGRFEMADSVNLEHLVGTGYICNGPIQICRTRYRVDTYLETSEEIIRNSDLLDRLKEIRGKISPIELSLYDIFGRNCTLVSKTDGSSIFSLQGPSPETSPLRPDCAHDFGRHSCERLENCGRE